MDAQSRRRSSQMTRKIMIVLAMAAVLTGGLTADALARGGGGGGGGGHGGGFGGGAHMGGGIGGGRNGGTVRNPTTLWGRTHPQRPRFENRIPAPLSSPAVAAHLLGQLGPPGCRGLTGIGQ